MNENYKLGIDKIILDFIFNIEYYVETLRINYMGLKYVILIILE